MIGKSPSLQTASGPHGTRAYFAAKLESTAFQNFIVAVILLNAVVLGLETSPAVMDGWGGPLTALDKACLAVFVAELGLKFFVQRLRFFRSGWNWFDLVVVGISLIPGSGVFAVLRALRVLRVLRLLTVLPGLRRVVAAFLHAIPGLGGVMAVMAVFFYTAGVLATKVFGGTFPDWFGTLGRSLYTLFQVMTLESWSMGIVRPVMETHPWAWCFFVPFIIIATFTILNLFIGIIVSTMQELAVKDSREGEAASAWDGSGNEAEIVMRRLEDDLALLRRMLQTKNDGDSAG